MVHLATILALVNLN